ncbi:DUF4229 domain-containing protein [Humidisolicoccus flavus]|uniref:DUF4229 domain-containing protein n=1 Tax=Humidisolicoccus flavus TaxID=3111414 RepID=UPI00324C4ECE
MKAVFVYSLWRTLLFLVPFTILMIANVAWYVSLPVALLFAFSASYVFLRRQRDAAAASLARQRATKTTKDDDAEDSVLDGVDAEASAHPAVDANEPFGVIDEQASSRERKSPPTI